MILSNDELEGLTSRTQAAAQARVLDFMGITYTKRPDGSLVVSKSHVEHLLGGVYDSKPNKLEPNWKAMRA